MVAKIKPKQEEKKEDDKQEKQQLLREDEFVARGSHAFDWVQHNAKAITVAVAMVFGVAGVIGVGTMMQRKSNTAASRDLAMALKTYHRPVSTVAPGPDTPEDEKPFATSKEKFTAARDALKPVAEQHTGGVAALAWLYLADCYMHLDDYENAVVAYDKVVKTTSATDSLRFLALEGLGHAQEAKGDKKAAIATFKDLAQLPTKIGNDYGLYQAGRLLVAQGEKDAAKPLLERLAKEKEFEGSSYKQKADELLAQ